MKISVSGLIIFLFAICLQNQSAAGPLHDAAKSGDAALVESLIEAGADVNEKDALDQTALHIAADGGFSDVASILLDKGADVNARGVSRYCGRHMWGPGWAPQDTPLASAALR